MPDTYYGLAWANDNATVFYTRVDEAMRPYQLWRHRLGTDPGDDVLVLEEADGRFTVSVGWTKDRAFVVATLQSNTTSEVVGHPGRRPRGAGPGGRAPAPGGGVRRRAPGRGGPSCRAGSCS